MTNDAKKVLFGLYKEYFDKISHGFTRKDSKYFGSSTDIQQEFFPEMYPEDIEDILFELSSLGLVDNIEASGSIYSCSLSSKGISVFEDLPKNSLKTFISFAFEIVKLVPNH